MINLNKKIIWIIIPSAVATALIALAVLHLFIGYTLNKLVSMLPEHSLQLAREAEVFELVVFILVLIVTVSFILISLPRFRKLAYQDVQKYLLALESASNHIVITDIDGIVIYANKGAENVTGYTFEEMKGNTPRLWGALMPQDFYKELWKTIKYDRESFYGEIKNRRKNQDEYYTLARISPIVDGDGKLTGFVATEEDVTERKQRESDLEVMNKAMVGRELKMIELKKQIKKLEEQT